jgi:hypothetical protein
MRDTAIRTPEPYCVEPGLPWRSAITATRSVSPVSAEAGVAAATIHAANITIGSKRRIDLPECTPSAETKNEKRKTKNEERGTKNEE